MAIEKYNSLCGTVKDAFNGEWQSLANKTAYSLGGASVGVVEGAIGKAAITKAHAKFNNVKCNATGKGCFVAGTIVATIYGGKAIEDVEVGDKVLASDPETGETAYKEVLKTYTYVKDTLVHVEVNGETIETTKEHPFWVEGQGWTKAKFLNDGDLLLDADGNSVIINKVEIVSLPKNQYTIVYNFEVADFHTYYVADSYVLVHNACQLLPDEGKFGTYKDLLKSGHKGDNITPHHMPSAEYMRHKGISTGDSTAFNVEQLKKGGRHRRTKTYGRNMNNVEKSKYYSLSSRDALAHDLWDLRKIYIEDGLYEQIRPQLIEYSKYVQNKNPNLF